MKLFGTREIDNRDTEQVYDYMEARIEALKQRIHELEAEKESLQANHWHTQVA
jgi:phage shock protein A